MAGASTFLSILAISQLAFLALYTYTNMRSHRVARLVFLFTICLASFLLARLPFIDDGGLVNSTLGALASLTPAVLWVFAVSLFMDDERIPGYGLGLIVLYFSLQTIGIALSYLAVERGRLAYVLVELVPMFIMLGLSVHVIYMGMEGRMADLVEERRRIRMPFVIIMGIVIVFVLLFGAMVTFVNVYSQAEGEPAIFEFIRLIISIAIFLWTLLLNLSLFSLRNESALLFENAPNVDVDKVYHSKQEEKLNREDPLIERIRIAMEDEQRYRETGFTITGLAAELSVPEQRLRTTINKKLGFRNFNQFLNYYRVLEAAEKLSNSEDPIGNIAMEVGYNSLSSFNKAFRESHGMPPRQWRSRE